MSEEPTQPADNPVEPRPLNMQEDAKLVLQGEYVEATRRLWEAQYSATHDELTGALNRRGLLEVVNRNNDRYKKLLFADGTNIKAINDYYGHQRGDEAIVGLAGVLQQSIRPGDLLCRIGGDEFVVLLSDDERGDQSVPLPEQFAAVERRISQNAESYLDENPELRRAGMHIAVGSTMWAPHETFTDVAERAERNMGPVKAGQHRDLGKHRP